MNDKVEPIDIMQIPASDLRHAGQWFDTGASAGGSFVNKLFDLCSVSDTDKLAKLNDAFPHLVGAWLHRQKGKQHVLVALGLVDDSEPANENIESYRGPDGVLGNDLPNHLDRGM